MELKEKYVAGLTIKILNIFGKMEETKRCSIEVLRILAERDLEWVEFMKEKYNIDIDYAKIRAQYEEAINAVKHY